MGGKGGRRGSAGSEEEVSEGQNGSGMNGTAALNSTFSRLPLAAARQPPPSIPIALSGHSRPKGQPQWKHFKSKSSITWCRKINSTLRGHALLPAASRDRSFWPGRQKRLLSVSRCSGAP